MRKIAFLSLLALAPFTASAELTTTTTSTNVSSTTTTAIGTSYSANCTSEKKEETEAKAKLDELQKNYDRLSVRNSRTKSKTNQNISKLEKQLADITSAGTQAFSACVEKLTSTGNLSRLGTTPTIDGADLTACTRRQQSKVGLYRRLHQKLVDKIAGQKTARDAYFVRLDARLADAQSDRDDAKIESDAAIRVSLACAAARPASTTPGTR